MVQAVHFHIVAGWQREQERAEYTALGDPYGQCVGGSEDVTVSGLCCQEVQNSVEGAGVLALLNCCQMLKNDVCL